MIDCVRDEIVNDGGIDEEEVDGDVAECANFGDIFNNEDVYMK